MKVSSAVVVMFLLGYSLVFAQKARFEVQPKNSELEKGKHQFLTATHSPENKKQQMNVVYIIADDLGKHDLSIYGNDLIQTPNIDKLAKEGVLFTEGYATASVCSPSRAGLITGRYPQRFGYHLQPHQRYAKNKFEWWWFRNFINTSYMTPTEYQKAPSQHDVVHFGLPSSELTLSELLKSFGYATAWIGKWHLGYHEGKLPKDFGFDYRYGCLEAYTLFADPKDKSIVNAPIKEFTDKVIWKGKRDGYCGIYENDVLVDEKEYLTYAFARRAMRFIDQYKDEPFFLYFPITAPHTPYQAPKVIYDSLSHIPEHSKRVYYSMILALDEIVGQLVEHLEKHNLLENTLIIFTSDNGAALYSETVTNYPLSGGKMTLYEGGVNVPLILYKKNDFPQRKVVTAPVTLLDIFVTIADMLQIALPQDREYDGKSLLPWIYEKPAKSPNEHIFWLSDYNYAIRGDQYKLIINDRDKTIFLYDLLADKSELIDLTNEKPEVVEAMKSVVQSWMATMPPLHWPRIMDYTVEINGKIQRWAV